MITHIYSSHFSLPFIFILNMQFIPEDRIRTECIVKRTAMGMFKLSSERVPCCGMSHSRVI